MCGLRIRPHWLVAALLLGSGCVHREIEIMSRPPGARVEFDGRIIEQRTPVRFPFTWYGTHEIILQRPPEKLEPGKPTTPGYHRERLIVHLTPPWYDQFPIDLFSNVLWPGGIYHIRTYPFLLEKAEPMDNVPDDEKAAMKGGLIERAERFRKMAWDELGGPPPRPAPEEPPAETKPAPEKPAEPKEAPEKKPEPAPEGAAEKK